ncbi:MAG: geranylgeranylglycerol-phosphate geranylgeranyltransferase, partial [Alphaproteobacteria bacterium]|nr:geranylgeranylglycerol-phosphate geranylgeranyltransferase [Alphaproteobacteria bacterium]
EIVKDVQDLVGDHDRRTLPATIGTPRALALAAIALLVAVALSFYAGAGFDGDARSGYLALVAAADAVMLYGLWQAQQGDARTGQKLLKQGMWVAMAAFIVGAGL